MDTLYGILTTDCSELIYRFSDDSAANAWLQDQSLSGTKQIATEDIVVAMFGVAALADAIDM